MDKKYSTIEDFLQLEQKYDYVYVEVNHQVYIDRRSLKMETYPYNMLYPKNKTKFTVRLHDYNKEVFQSLLLISKLANS